MYIGVLIVEKHTKVMERSQDTCSMSVALRRNSNVYIATKNLNTNIILENTLHPVNATIILFQLYSCCWTLNNLQNGLCLNTQLNRISYSNSILIYLSDFRKQFRRDEQGRYLCPKCAVSYKRKWHLVEHVRFDCGLEPQFSCKLCSKKFSRKNRLTRHIVLTHNQ